MFDAAGFRALYELLSGDQTLDALNQPVDCGIQCGQACCNPAQSTKYLLPGERAFLEAELDKRDEPPFGMGSLGFFDTQLATPGRTCACAPHRDVRPFNCRVFPYGPRVDVDNRRVIGLRKAKLRHITGCWIETPAPLWNDAALVAWQRVLDDVDNRKLFARLGALWEWNEADERGDDPGPVLAVLAKLETATEAEQWTRVARFFRGGDEPTATATKSRAETRRSGRGSSPAAEASAPKKKSSATKQQKKKRSTTASRAR